MSIKVQKINFDVDSEYLKIDGKLRSENGENVVDIAMDLLKDISDPVYVSHTDSIKRLFRISYESCRSKAKYSRVSKANPVT